MACSIHDDLTIGNSLNEVRCFTDRAREISNNLKGKARGTLPFRLLEATMCCSLSHRVSLCVEVYP